MNIDNDDENCRNRNRNRNRNNDPNIPWQVDWKHPQWNCISSPSSPSSPSSSCQNNTNSTVGGVTSAMVTWDELPDALSEQLQNHASSSPSCQYMLTVSLLCTDNNNNNNNVSQEILLELAEIHTTYQTTELLLAKRLQWPETIFGMTTEEEEETSQASVVSWFSWFDKLLDKLPHKPRKPQGVVSATLCRRNPSSVNQNQTDALDMIAWMSLGIVNEETAGTTTATATATATTTPASTEVNQPASANNTSTTISTTFTSMLCDLYLCCISSRGLVAIYSPWTLLLDEPPPSSTTTTTTTDPEPLFSDDAMTHFFLGMELSIKLNQIWRPLCQPLTTISLSVLENSTPFHNHKKGQQTNPLWNPFVEPTTLPHRTIHNRLTNIQVAGDSFLVLLGQGKRPKPKNNNDATQDEGLLLRQPSLRRTWWESKRDMSVDFKEALADVDYDDDNDKEEKEEQELQDEMQEQINHPNDFDEETPWWANNSSTGGSGSLSPTPKEKETNPPTTTTSESTSNPTRPTTKPKPNKTTFQEDIPAVSSKLSKPKTTAHEELAGFVTFCSIAHWSETRTFFLPFVPRSVSYIAQFQSMELLLVLGDTEAVAIRMDNPEITSLTVAADASVAGGTILGTTETNVASTTTNTSTQDTVTSIGNNKTIKIRRFQVMPILMNNTDSNDGRLLCAASPSEPPALLQLFSENQQHGLVLHKTLQTITPLGIEMGHAPGHVAKLSCDPQQTESLEGSWAFSGQGWSLFGTSQKVYLICWEGATASRGVTFVQELDSSSVLSSAVKNSYVHVSNVLPLPDEIRTKTPSIRASTIQMPFSEPYERLMDDYENDDIVLDALESISGLSYRSNATSLAAIGVPESFSPRKTLSHRQKSVRLLQHCPSWTQLENTLENRRLLERQVPVVSLRFGGNNTPHYILTFRQLVIDNGPACPFQQVLSWLCNREDYFTAASIALDLLHDADSLFHLWENAEKIDEEDEQTKLEGLLDGIIPIPETSSSSSEDQVTKKTASLVQLADMTVGCLIKGGFGMSKTLRKFLKRNKEYDPARACLMLVAAAASAVSDDPQSVASVMGKDVSDPSHADLLWPIRCLLEIGVSRDYLNTALILLNVTIPDELRRRSRQATESVPEIELTKSLVCMVVATHPSAADLLLGLVDDESRTRFWQSLEHETRLELSLINIEKKCPLLRHAEVRSWVREQLHTCLKNEKSANMNLFEIMPTLWLQDLCAACLHNAGCDLNDLAIDTNTTNYPCSAAFSDTSSSDDLDCDFADDGLEKHRIEILETRNALTPAQGSGGLDFDLLIPALLLLQSRRSAWREPGNYAPTQSLLNTVCYLAGRDDKEEPTFAFDGKTVMRQCALAGNIRGGANLIGGKNGFVLSCCDILMLELQISMEDAEAFFLEDTFSLRIIKESSNYLQPYFELTHSHRELLWLLAEHVLSIRTFGEFETIHIRGRVDPVFCARSFFRAWLCLTYADKKNGSIWLEKYLRGRLGICDGHQISSHRLVCAALTRALMWPSNGLNVVKAVESGQMLGNLLEMESKFLLQLAQSCCGLVESVPTMVAEDVIGMAEAREDISTSMSLVLDGTPNDTLMT